MVRVALLYGDPALVDEYDKHVADKLKAISSLAEEGSSSAVGRRRGIQQLSKDIDTFFPFKTFFGLGCAFNAKKDFYRLISLLLSDLALIFNIRYPTPWQVISELQTRGIIDESDMADIKVCLSIANEIRLKTYLTSNKQKEVLSSFPRYFSANTAEQQAEQSPNNSHFYPDFDEDVAVRLLCTSMDIHERCTEFSEKYKNTNEIDTSLLRNTSTSFQLSKRCLIGHIYIALSNYPKAFELLEPLSKDSESPGYMKTFSGLGIIYNFHREYAKSIECFEAALEACRRSTQQNDKSLIQDLSIITGDLAQTLNENGEFEKALSTLKEAISKHNEIYGKESRKPELRRLMCQLGVVYGELGKNELAIQTFKHVEWMLSGGGFDGELFNTKALLALTLCWKDCSQALQCAEEALLLAQKLFGNESARLAETYQSVGMVYERCSRIEEALSYYQLSLTMHTFRFGDIPHPGTVR